MTAKDVLRPYVLAARRFRRGEIRLVDLAYGRGTTFSQFGEDAVLGAIFADQRDGFYVDVGAYDAFNASNTYNLYRRGWRGINIEPDPGLFANLARRRPRDINLPVAVSETVGTAPFASAGSFSGIADDTHLWTGMGDTITVETRPLATILDEHLPAGVQVDLLDVDCEGHDLTVLRSNDWERHRPRVVLAEWHEGQAIPDYLGRLDYELIARLQLTGVFIAR